LVQERGQYALALADLDAYLLLPQEDDEYQRLAARTAAVLREVVAELGESSTAQTG
jgi:hypothetical protein